MLIRLFTANVSSSANQFTENLEQTANVIIRRLEEEAAQLELLLEEAEMKIGMLSQQVEHANKIIDQMAELGNYQDRKNICSSYNETAFDSEIKKTQLASNERQMYAEDKQEPAGTIFRDAEGMVKETAHNEKYRYVISMYEQGYNITEIAKVTGIGKGEIMLLLQLNK